MANPDRLSALDSTFLHLEDNSTAHMHVASVMIFEGEAPTPQELVDHVLSRLHLVPRYRQRLAYVPLGQGRPVWTDDPHFNPRYHIRHTALPRPADERRAEAARRAAVLAAPGPLQAAVGDLARGADGRRALRADREDPPRARRRHLRRRHHDGAVRHRARAGPDVAPAGAPGPPSRCPGSAKLLGEALLERTTVPGEMTRGARALLRAPRQGGGTGEGRPREHRRDDSRRHQRAGARRARSTSTSARTAATPSSTRDLAQFKAIKDSLGGTLNDVVLASVSLALGRYLRAQGHDTEGLVLKAMVPVSVRADSQRGALGNQVAAMWAPLPVGVEDPAECLRADRRARWRI